MFCTFRKPRISVLCVLSMGQDFGVLRFVDLDFLGSLGFGERLRVWPVRQPQCRALRAPWTPTAQGKPEEGRRLQAEQERPTRTSRPARRAVLVASPPQRSPVRRGSPHVPEGPQAPVSPPRPAPRQALGGVSFPQSLVHVCEIRAVPRVPYHLISNQTRRPGQEVKQRFNSERVTRGSRGHVQSLALVSAWVRAPAREPRCAVHPEAGRKAGGIVLRLRELPRRHGATGGLGAGHPQAGPTRRAAQCPPTAPAVLSRPDAPVPAPGKRRRRPWGSGARSGRPRGSSDPLC